jgi:DNA-binding cell septation regulator SpoVG
MTAPALQGFRIFDDDGRSDYAILAISDVNFLDIGLHLNGVKLIKRQDGEFAAMAPTGRTYKGVLGVWWSWDSKLERAIRRALLKAYQELQAEAA